MQVEPAADRDPIREVRYHHVGTQPVLPLQFLARLTMGKIVPRRWTSFFLALACLVSVSTVGCAPTGTLSVPIDKPSRPLTEATAAATAKPADPFPAAKAAGASAVCGDHTLSFSQSRSGTCLEHGGVLWWTGNVGVAGPGAP